MKNVIDFIQNERNNSVEVFENDTHTVINVYDNIFKSFSDDKNNIVEQIKNKFNLKIKVNIPDVILTESGDNYYVGIDKYDENVEFFTIFIEK